jgi:23S rRNA pseudouridine2605 synthase
LSKLGFCSRREAWELIREGRVTLNGRVCREPERPVLLAKDRLEVDAQSVAAAHRVYLMLNKPRGLVTTAADEQGRATVFACFTEADLPKISPVGRLDMASEGLLLFTNDHDWAAGLLDPNRHVAKTYDVQIDRLADDGLLELLRRGVLYGQETLKVREVRLLRAGHRHCWLQIGLEEGRNRHLRRMFEALGIVVRRLVRIRIGGLELGNLQKGAWRHLTPAEVAALRSAGCGLPVTAAGTAPPPDRRSAARAR